MNKHEFMEQLNRHLVGLSEVDRSEIRLDFEEHFQAGEQAGRTEEDIADSLGNPKVIAKQMKASYMVTRAEQDTSVSNIIHAIIATSALGLLNLIIIVPIFITIVAVLLSLFAAGGSIVISGLLLLVASIVEPINGDIFHLMVHPAAGFFLSIGVVVLGFLWNIGIYYLSKFFYHLTVNYLRLNINILK